MGGGGGQVVGGSDWWGGGGGHVRYERRIEVFVKIKKKKLGGRVGSGEGGRVGGGEVRVDVNRKKNVIFWGESGWSGSGFGGVGFGGGGSGWM